MVQTSINTVAESSFGVHTPNQYGTLQKDGVKVDLATDWSWHDGLDHGSIYQARRNMGDHELESNPRIASTSVLETEIERARIVDMRNSIRMHTQTVSADQPLIVETPFGFSQIVANGSPTSVRIGMIRFNSPGFVAYSQEYVGEFDARSLAIAYPEFAHVIMEANDDDDPLPTPKALFCARLLMQFLGSLTPIAFESFPLTGTIWLTAEAPSRKHITIKCKPDGGLMVLSNTTSDPLHQDEKHYANTNALKTSVYEICKLLSVRRA